MLKYMKRLLAIFKWLIVAILCSISIVVINQAIPKVYNCAVKADGGGSYVVKGKKWLHGTAYDGAGPSISFGRKYGVRKGTDCTQAKGVFDISYTMGTVIILALYVLFLAFVIGRAPRNSAKVRQIFFNCSFILLVAVQLWIYPPMFYGLSLAEIGQTIQRFMQEVVQGTNDGHSRIYFILFAVFHIAAMGISLLILWFLKKWFRISL